MRYDAVIKPDSVSMAWHPFLLLRIFVQLALGLLVATAHAATTDSQLVRIGVLAYRGNAQATQAWQAHADFLNTRLPGNSFRIVPLSYPEINEAVRLRSIELLITNTGHYTELEATGNVSRIATRLIASPQGPLNRFGGTAIALANRDDLQHYSDLKGKRLLIPDKSSLGGWQVHLGEALAQGVHLERQVAQLRETDNHEKVVQGILAGEADAGFVRSDLIESMIAQGKLAAGALRIIDARDDPGYPYLHSTRLYPEWPLARVGDFPEEISKAILIALLAMPPDDPAAQAAGIHGWTLPQNYQSVLDLFREARLGPYANPDITWKDLLARHGKAMLVVAVGILALLLIALTLVLRSNRHLRDSDASLRLAAGVFNHAEEGILITDPSGRIVQVNERACHITGYSTDELIGQTPRLFRSQRQDAAFYEALWKTLLSTGRWRGEIWNKRKDGSIYAQRTSISSIRDRDEVVTHFIGLFSDITELKESQERLEHQAYFDALTGLPNRVLLADRLHQAIAQSNRRGDLLAVCYLDLDDFKPINDRWGHDVGDRLLIEVARRLTQCLRQNDTVSRLGGDEFVILIGELSNLTECEQTLQRISEALTAPFAIAAEPACISASIGVALYPSDGVAPDTLLRHADQAMYAAKQAGRHRFEMFCNHDDAANRARQEQQDELRQAMARGEFVLYFQPKVDMRAGRLVGVEALLRWQHPQRGLLCPASFLAQFDRAGLQIELGEYVVDRALAQMASWADPLPRLTVSLNIDAVHLQQTAFVSQLQALLQRHPSANAHWFELEILEAAAVKDLDLVAQRISECRALGVQFAIDDFGTGYSSLAYLKRLPVRTLKIDRSFVQNMLNDPDSLAVADGVIGLAKAFRHRVIAVGIENIAQGSMLLQLGCELGQGYAIAPPMPASELVEWASHWQAPAEWRETGRWPNGDLALLTAEIDHLCWVREFEALIQAAPNSGLPVPPLDPGRCRFGEWISNDGRDRYAQLPEFQAIIPLHERVHQLGHELFVQHTHNPDAARYRLTELATARSELLAQLARLRQTVVAAEAAHGASA